jgi:two-component system, NtrC family, sensor histidine kinase PilS
MTGTVSIIPWGSAAPAAAGDSAMQRLWRGFGTARIAIGLLLTGLVTLLPAGGPGARGQQLALALCVLYTVAAVSARLTLRVPRGATDPRWMATVGLDLVTFAALQFLQAGGVQYWRLFALPVLMAAVLGPRILALATAAVATLLMLAEAWMQAHPGGGPAASALLQASLTGVGYLAIALLANSLAQRLAREEKRALESAAAARIQAQVNELVITTLGDGVVVADEEGTVRAINPTACQLMGHARMAPGFHLGEQDGWRPLLALARKTIELGTAQLAEVALGPDRHAGNRTLVRTRLARADSGRVSLCVMFLEDVRELEARVRTEKLAAMGRMSAAVAHELRNPLAAIAQANALLEEELTDPRHRQLTGLVAQNAQRLAQLAEEVLSVASVRQQGRAQSVPLALDAQVRSDCAEWVGHSGAGPRLRLWLQAGPTPALFEPDHLRRVLVNLLDNALRYASTQPDAIQVVTELGNGGPVLRVWSDGAPLDKGVERYLFEPFFTSESRSSGLGLYICRELCERHAATIAYRRGPAPLGVPRDGNEFHVQFAAGGARLETPAAATIAPP